MSNKELVVTACTAAFINRDISAVDKYWSVDYIQHNPQVGNGLEGIKKLLSYLPKDFKYEMGLVLADGEFVMFHSRATNFGPKPLIIVDLFRVKDGKIAEHWDVMQEEVAAENTASKNAMFPILQTAAAV
jgi:predicted SnoaL-like aldol condensation-catalyzing enzyme